MKRVLAALGVLVVLTTLAVGGVALYLSNVIETALAPPVEDPSLPSIASYADEALPAGIAPSKSEPTFDVNAICRPSRDFQPWTRWWWPGNNVDPQRAIEQLRRLSESGIGGVEIQPFVSSFGSVTNQEVLDRVFTFDTPQYYETLSLVMAEADLLGMQVDLTHMTGFPGGSTAVLKSDGVQNLVHAEKRVAGGGRLVLELPKPKPNSSDYFNVFFELVAFNPHFANFAEGDEELVSVLAAKVTGGDRSWNPLRGDDTLELEPGTVTVLTQYVENGQLTWDVPEGDWAVIAVYRMPSAEPPLLPAYRTGGNVVDHLRSEMVLGHYNYAFGRRTGLPDYYGQPFRAIFNDSFEFRADRMTHPEILAEFSRRRGYDLEPLLPALMRDGGDNFWLSVLIGLLADPSYKLTDIDDRIVYDYNKTISELFFENFVVASSDWAKRRGLKTRTQFYGADFDLLRGFSGVDIPEVESLAAGGSELLTKFAASASAFYDKPIVSAESFAFANKDHQETPRLLKAVSDKLFTGGVNEIIYHGTSYAMERWDGDPFPEPGWHPFSGEGVPPFGSNVSETNPLWDDFRPLNSYLSRTQHLLRSGRPNWDLLVFYPHLGMGFVDFETTYVADEPFVSGRMPDADGVSVSVIPDNPFARFIPKNNDLRVKWKTDFKQLANRLTEKGLTWTWVNGTSLEDGFPKDKSFVINNNTYGAILLPDVEVIEPETLDRFVLLAQSGVPIILWGQTPSRQPGYKEAEAGDAYVSDRTARLIAAGARVFSKEQAQETAELLKQYRQTSVAYESHRLVRRVSRDLTPNLAIHFFANQTADDQSVEITLDEPREAYWFDAMTGQFATAELDQDNTTRLDLAGYESRFLLAGLRLPEGLTTSRSNLFDRAPDRVTPLPNWDLSVEVDDETIEVENFQPTDWRLVPSLKYASGPATYMTTVSIGSPDTEMHLLDLRLVHGAADVFVNGQYVDTAITSPFLVDVSAYLDEGDNEIKLVIRVPAHNQFLKRAKDGVPGYGHFQAEADADSVMASGMVGEPRIIHKELSQSDVFNQCAEQ